MKNIVTTLLLFLGGIMFSQNVQLHCSGTNDTILKAVTEANRILTDSEFYGQINNIKKFDNTTYSGSQIVSDMKSIKVIEVTEYFKKHTKVNAKTLTGIKLNTAKLNRSFASIVNTLIHETVHAVDWAVNHHFVYTHRTQYEENPPISAPYVIGAIAEKMVKQ